MQDGVRDVEDVPEPVGEEVAEEVGEDVGVEEGVCEGVGGPDLVEEEVGEGDLEGVMLAVPL